MKVIRELEEQEKTTNLVDNAIAAQAAQGSKDATQKINNRVKILGKS